MITTATSFQSDLEKSGSDELLQELKQQLSTLQEVLYADNKKSLLIIFQAMDAAGKDSAIK
ncbi:MAG: polyphosphate kinase 2 family protein, partial [Sphingobacteriales bacterium]